MNIEEKKSINNMFLFQENGYGKGFFEGQIQERKYWKDKIKEKIEELNEKSFKYDINYSEFYYKKEVLQSLLEERRIKMRNYKEEYKRQKEKYICVRAFIDKEIAIKLKEKLKKDHKTIAGWIVENTENYINYE